MALWWLVYTKGDTIEVYLQGAGDLLKARMKASMAGQDGEFKEGHALAPNLIKKIPKKVIGRTLAGKQTAKLLKLFLISSAHK
jgi:hypothetical protein